MRVSILFAILVAAITSALGVNNVARSLSERSNSGSKESSDAKSLAKQAVQHLDKTVLGKATSATTTTTTTSNACEACVTSTGSSQNPNYDGSTCINPGGNAPTISGIAKWHQSKWQSLNQEASSPQLDFSSCIPSQCSSQAMVDEVLWKSPCVCDSWKQDNMPEGGKGYCAFLAGYCQNSLPSQLQQRSKASGLAEIGTKKTGETLSRSKVKHNTSKDVQAVQIDANGDTQKVSHEDHDDKDWVSEAVEVHQLDLTTNGKCG